MEIDRNAAIESVTRRTDSLLWSAYEAAVHGTIPPSGRRLVFPRRETGALRVSEQEARFFFVHALEESSFVYSVETPTKKLYQQKGIGYSRAAFDATVADGEGRNVRNVEFKFGGISPERKNRTTVAKDMEKLLRDPGDGLWFHLLEAVDNSTLTKVLTTLRGELAELLSRYGPEIAEKTLTMHICVLRQGFSIHREVALHARLEHSELSQTFSLPYTIKRGELMACSVEQGWRLWKGATSTQLSQRAVAVGGGP